ncbi:MAG: alpha/beta hydrolase [Candidatus Saccharimonadales bacterium]
MKSVRASIALPFLNRHMNKMLTMSLREARQYFETITTTRVKTRIRRVVDDTIDSISIRIYQHNHDASQPVMIFFHGGGFSLGSIATHDTLARQLCKRTQMTIISVGYSLAPEHTHPTPILEALRVIEVLPDLAKKYDFNPREITLAGDSAGGFIALHTALRANTPISSLVLIYPSIDPEADTASMKQFATRHFLTLSNIRAFWKQYLKGELITPLTPHTVDMLPPTLIITAEYDVLRDEARDFYAQMRNLGKACQYEEIRGVWHGFMSSPNFISGRSRVFPIIRNFIAMHRTR